MILSTAGSAPLRGRSPATGGAAFAFFPRPHDSGMGAYASAAASSYSTFVEVGAGPANSHFAGATIRSMQDTNSIATIEFATGAAGAEQIFAAVPFVPWYTSHSVQLLLPLPVFVADARVSYRLLAGGTGFQTYVKGLFIQASPSHIEPWRV